MPTKCIRSCKLETRGLQVFGRRGRSDFPASIRNFLDDYINYLFQNPLLKFPNAPQNLPYRLHFLQYTLIHMSSNITLWVVTDPKYFKGFYHEEIHL